MSFVTDLTGLSPDLVARADHELIRTVDGLPDPAYAEPSLLPGWSRAHVIAHLTLNAEGLAGVLHGAHVGEPRPMYASQEARATDLDGTWRYGEGDGGPVITGTASALGWWLTGRGSGEGLTSDTGVLPEMEAW